VSGFGGIHRLVPDLKKLLATCAVGACAVVAALLLAVWG
jgi:hypothetical protein